MSQDSHSNDYNPNSINASLARIIARLDNQDIVAGIYRSEVRDALASIKTGVDKTNGRVTRLEREKWVHRGFVAAISMLATAAYQWWTGHK